MNNKPEINMVIFDMAGTTVNEDNVVYKSLQKAINNLGHNFSLNTVLLNGGGKEKLQAVKDIMKPAYSSQEELEKDAQIAFAEFLEILKKAYADLEVSTYEGTESLFKDLRSNDIKVVLNTGYNEKTATSLLDKLQWKEGETYDLLVTADDVQNSRPAPDMIFVAMEKMGIEDANKVAKIGDSIVDIEEGKSAGCGLTFGVTTGAQTASQLETGHPDYIIDSLLEIKEYISLKNPAHK
ncbi:phosphonatase-like hydrolase [Algoriphagus halophilus]|uniref:Phosphonatase-like hydrolase n=1 Tax=Algoriphagus halophilus TaxID=226505 RepID=A0A1N6DKI1_9BACT|nr:phosphonatase-like hydrolase [Algoriphagus halophilus]SIN71184.1 phosphonatase-like hydrolase [Algoriphagus halophilus]